MTKIITERYPRDSIRNKERQTKCWEDEVTRVAGPEWIRLPKDKKKRCPKNEDKKKLPAPPGDEYDACFTNAPSETVRYGFRKFGTEFFKFFCFRA
ncbi:hypothetical protein EVAR_50405_1 [Eumeta japonica]|uniref:Uncharacterized protein n=1 Tax=Eumeta variegata TaxID=151549 RepID=A0A4C1WUG1_EUMVA|nr:hypothetical protein EVAR_50405_1 [Eumeta japonica]